MDDKEELIIARREEIIQKIIDALNERPEYSSAGELCADALNRMLKDRNVICQVRFLWKAEPNSPFGI